MLKIAMMCAVTLIFSLAACGGTTTGWNNVPDITDRAFWEKQKSVPGMDEQIAQAKKQLAGKLVSPLPHYLDFSKDGNRDRYQGKYSDLRRMGALTLTACMTQDRKFVDNIEQRIRMLASLPSWVLPAHDRQLKNYRGETVEIDLGSSLLGADLACILRVLGPVLSPEVRKLLTDELERRIIVPMEDMMNGKRPEQWWVTTKNNWNAVCLSGVAAVVFRLDMEPERRQKLLDYIQKRSVNFLDGFSGDGYCSEGINYWVYGFGHYMRMAADFRQATGGKVDLMAGPKVRKPAYFPENMQMAPGVYPAFADATLGTMVTPYIISLRNYLEGKAEGFPAKSRIPQGLTDACLFLSLPESGEYKGVVSTEPFTAFVDANVFVARARNRTCRLAAAFKGGSNEEFHNHNDVGSYVIAVDGVPVVVDPGKEIYTARTFSSRRYESKLLNSYGHGVPKIAGQLQATGANTAAVRKALTQEKGRDGVVLDIAAAYRQISGIRKLERAFDYSREGAGYFMVTDTAEFAQPLTFENAVISLGSFEKVDDHTYRITEGGKKLLLTIDCGGAPFSVSQDVIHEDTPHKRDVNRFAIQLDGKVKSVKMTLTFKPED